MKRPKEQALNPIIKDRLLIVDKDYVVNICFFLINENNMKHLTIFSAFLFSIVSFLGCQSKSDFFTIQYLKEKPSLDSTLLNHPLWSNLTPVDGLINPWNNDEKDQTQIRCFATDEHIFFKYDVFDTTVFFEPNFQTKRDIEKGDRVEVFFSAKKNLEVYYCAEVGPNAHVLDYEARYYRNLNFDWSFEQLKSYARINDNGYTVVVVVPRAELENRGIQLEEGFYMGLFRAEFCANSEPEWFSYLDSDDPEPDFHTPKVMFETKVVKLGRCRPN